MDKDRDRGPELEIVQKQRGNEIATFEIGYRSLEPGVDYVVNGNRIEEIYAIEEGTVEGENYQEVETISGPYKSSRYPVDGTTIFAKRLK